MSFRVKRFFVVIINEANITFINKTICYEIISIGTVIVIPRKHEYER